MTCANLPQKLLARERERERGRNTRAVLSLTCAFLILLSFNAGKRFLSIFIFPLLVQRPTHVRRNETVFPPLPSEFFGRARTSLSPTAGPKSDGKKYSNLNFLNVNYGVRSLKEYGNRSCFAATKMYVITVGVLDVAKIAAAAAAAAAAAGEIFESLQLLS